MNGDLSAAMFEDFYILDTIAGKRCHEEWMFQGEGADDYILYYSCERLFSRKPKLFISRYKGKRLLPIPAEQRQEAVSFLDEEEAEKVCLLSEPADMRYTPKQYLNLKKKAEKRKKKLLIDYRPRRWPFLMIMIGSMAPSVILFDGIDGLSFWGWFLFFMGSILLTIGNAVFSLNERHVIVAAALGWLPNCMRLLVKLFSTCWPLALSISGISVLLAALMFSWNLYRRTGIQCAAERGRNIFAYIVSGAGFMIAVLASFIPALRSLVY